MRIKKRTRYNLFKQTSYLSLGYKLQKSIILEYEHDISFFILWTTTIDSLSEKTSLRSP